MTEPLELMPGDSIHFDDITQLPAFEDYIASMVDPDMTDSMQQAWNGRVALRDIVRPPKFNGSIRDIQLVVMEDPYDRLLDLKERGWKLNKSRLGNPTSQSDVVDSFQGFTFIADALSSGRGTIGQIQAEIWYNCVPLQKRPARYTAEDGTSKTARTGPKTAKIVSHTAGASVQRRVTIPRIEADKFIQLNETSRQIGFEVLKQNMMHPIIQPINQ